MLPLDAVQGSQPRPPGQRLFLFTIAIQSIIVGKKWDPGILDPGRFSAQIRKVEARLGKLAKIIGKLRQIRKVETN